MGASMKLSGWRLLGKVVNSAPGRYLTERDAGVVADLMAVTTPVEPTGPLPWSPLDKAVASARVALVTTAGVLRQDQEPFDVDAAQGDPAFRVIPGDQELRGLRVAHEHYATHRAARDPNVVFPLGRLREAAAAGGIESVAPRHFSWGFSAHTRALVEPPDGTAHQAARLLVEDAVDLALLVPA